MSTRFWTRSGRLSPGALLVIGCAGTNLEPPIDHPGHPSARSGQLVTAQALRADFDPAAASVPALAVTPADSGAVHGHHVQPEKPPSAHGPDHDHAGQVWSCPMHPEVVRNQPDRCPKCGMKLEHRKSDGGAKP